MAQSKLYRSFIILQEDERGHSVSKEKPLSGYAKIEVKANICKVAFYAQNLKKDYENCEMVLICSKKDAKTLVTLGSMNITGQGKVESSLEHDSENIGNTGVSYDKIVGAAICKEVGGKTIYLMCGFLNGEQPTNNWKDYGKVTCSKEKKEDKKSYVKEDKHDDKDCDKKYKKDKDKKDKHDKKYDDNKKCDDDDHDYDENKKYKHHDDDCDYDDKKNKYDDDYDKKDCGCDDEREESKFDKYEDSINVEELTRGTEEFEMRGAMADFFSNVIDGLEEVKIPSEIKNVKWFKVPVSSFDEMCNVCNYNKYTTLYYPMINYYPYIIKNDEFMIGIKCNEKGKAKYLVYGIHGTKDKLDQPYAGKTGFVTFVPMGTDGKGCWLMFYDFRNSMVVVPMK